MFELPPAIVSYISANEYEVSFTIKKPFTKTSETVKANSTNAARNIIKARYGEDNVTIHSVKEIKK
jgi:hypothetical protein